MRCVGRGCWWPTKGAPMTPPSSSTGGEHSPADQTNASVFGGPYRRGGDTRWVVFLHEQWPPCEPAAEVPDVP